jgi:uncharacterized membrane protein YgdD (TMEM256/DUF423 family)
MISRTDINQPLLTLAGLAGAAGVALAAAGSHVDSGLLTTAANFLLFHAPVLLGLSLLKANRVAAVAGYVLVVALALFAGDLVMRGLVGHSLFPFAAPLGGVALIVGWVLVTASAWVGWRS